MIYLRHGRLNNEQLEFAEDIKLYATLFKNKPIEKGHPFYERGADLKYWTRRTKAVYIETYRSKLSGKLIHKVRNASKNIIQLTVED